MECTRYNNLIDFKSILGIIDKFIEIIIITTNTLRCKEKIVTLQQKKQRRAGEVPKFPKWRLHYPAAHAATDFVILLQKEVVTDAAHAKKSFSSEKCAPQLVYFLQTGQFKHTPAILCFATDQDSFTVMHN